MAGKKGGARGGAMARKKKQARSDTSTKSSGAGSGFGISSRNQTPASPITKKSTGSIYSLPALYDLAFGYRCYEEEVQFLLNAYRIHSTGSAVGEGPKRVLELAAGPARHSLTALTLEGTPVQEAVALDVSEDMVKYGNEVADEELGNVGERRDRFRYVRADMRTFQMSVVAGEVEDETKLPKFDAAWMLLGSMQHLTTNDDVIACLQSTSRVLRRGGILVVELPNPRETFTMGECTRNGWEVPLEDENGEEYAELKIIWGDDDDPFDPIRQVRDFTVAMELNGDGEGAGELQSVREVVPMRLFTSQELDALGRCGGFEMAAMYGALSEEVSVDDEDEAYRLVCVLRKV